MNLNRKIEKIENQLYGSLPVQENPEFKWAFDRARARFGSPYDHTAKKVEVFFQNLMTDPPPDQGEIEDVQNPHYEADPNRRAVKVREHASKLIKKFGDEKNYHRIRNENCPVTKYFRGLMESNERQRALGEPIY
ncbi:MAG: hypothetical protein PF482_19680 [Desulfobacteraceae bacterium]|jgi:hypothetical protein|nr:hypothetical protein [Desulfobacteraceae bacterium]